MNNQKTTLKILTITSIISVSNLAFSNEHQGHSMEMKDNKMDHSNMDHSNMNHSNMSHENHGESEDSIFICPMHPEIMSESEGTCPICNMALEKTYFDEE